jgi:TIR domain
MPLRSGVTSKHPPDPHRDAVMISHAVEDNIFTRWLALQLARNGYRVWCDLTKLLGGEIFWRDIERALRFRAAKFIYVLSRTSNAGQGRGFWKELDLADSEARRNGIHDFIIPIAIDDLPSSEYNIYLHSRNAIPSHPHWSEGLEKLLLKLAKDKVPQNSRSFNDAAVTQWCRRFHNASIGIKRKPETYLSCWLALDDLPKTLYALLFRMNPGINYPPQPSCRNPRSCRGTISSASLPPMTLQSTSNPASSTSCSSGCCETPGTGGSLPALSASTNLPTMPVAPFF